MSPFYDTSLIYRLLPSVIFLYHFIFML